MHNFLAKCAILALLAGGFAFTGDATRLLRRGRGILDATTIPTPAPAIAAEDPPAPAASDSGPAADTLSPEAAAGVSAPALPTRPSGLVEAAPTAPEPAVPASGAATGAPARPADVPVGAPVSATIPAGGPRAVLLSDLAPGDRVIVWIGKSSGRGRATMVGFDIVDPATGDAIELRHASGAENQATLAPFRRVRIAGSIGAGFLGSTPIDRGRIVCRKSLCVETLDGTAAADSKRVAEPTGPVVAIAIAPAATGPVKQGRAMPDTPASPTPKPAPAGISLGGQPAP